MATVTVTKVGKSRSNKDVVYFDNKHDFQDAYYIGNKCPSIPQVGQLIEPSASSSEFRGNTYWYLNSWKGVGTSPARPVDTPQGSDQSAPREPLKGWDIQSGDLSRYVSNVVGSAIAAGLIKTPLQLLEWSGVAYVSAESLRNGTANAMGISTVRPDPNTHAGDPASDLQGALDSFEGDNKIPF